MPASTFTDAYERLVERLIALRKSRSMHQADLAKRVGKSQQFVSAVERRIRRLDVIELYAVLRALEADPAAFVSELYGTLPKNVSI